MIKAEQLTEIGQFNSPHGIKGEISATVDADVDLPSLRCIVVEMDGLFVPFFVSTVRPKSHSSLLLTVDGINDENQASQLRGKTIYALSEECNFDDEADEAGFYAADLIGFAVKDSEGKLDGEIVDIDDTTENVLFVVEDKNFGRLLIPVVEEFISEIDEESRRMTVDLPDGFFEIF